jgi:hypothetical protein
VTWRTLKGLITQAECWSVTIGHDITKPEMLLVCLLAVLTINSQGTKAEENYTHWSFVSHPPILHPNVWGGGEPLPVFWNNASNALGGRPLPEQLQLSQYNGSFVGHFMCFCPPSDINMTCPISCLQAQLNYRYTWDNSTGVGLLLSTVVPVTIVLMLTALDPLHHLLFSPTALSCRFMHMASVLIMCLGQLA